MSVHCLVVIAALVAAAAEPAAVDAKPPGPPMRPRRRAGDPQPQPQLPAAGGLRAAAKPQGASGRLVALVGGGLPRRLLGRSVPQLPRNTQRAARLLLARVASDRPQGAVARARAHSAGASVTLPNGDSVTIIDPGPAQVGEGLGVSGSGTATMMGQEVGVRGRLQDRRLHATLPRRRRRAPRPLARVDLPTVPDRDVSGRG
jgi:hypothetical protein